MRITSHQLRAARGLLSMSVIDLAQACGVHRDTIDAFEHNLRQPRKSSMDAIYSTLNGLGVDFIGHDGVTLRDNTLRVINSGDPYMQLLDDVLLTLQAGDEVLFAFVRNALSPPEVIAKDMLMRQQGIKFRSLIEEGDNYCLYPLKEYRCVPKEYFQNNTQVIYGDKVGSMIGGNKIALIINNKNFAETQRKIFDLIWSTHKMPPPGAAPPVEL